MSKVLTILYILPSIVFANLKNEFRMYSLDQSIEKMQYITPGLVDIIKQTWIEWGMPIEGENQEAYCDEIFEWFASKNNQQMILIWLKSNI